MKKGTGTLGLVFKIFSFTLSALLAISGICLVVAACHLFFTGGDTPYTRARVGEYLIRIIVPLALTVASAIATGVISLILPKDEERGRLPVDEGKMVRRLYARYTITEKCENGYTYVSGDGDKGIAVTAASAKIIRKQKTIRLISAIASTVCTAFSIIGASILAFNSRNYTLEDINGSVIAVCLFVIPLALFSLLCWIAYTFLARASYRRELEQIKAAVAAPEYVVSYTGDVCAVRKFLYRVLTFLDKHDLIITWIVRGVVITVAVTFIILGIFNGGAADVLGKAVKICTECIGLG